MLRLVRNDTGADTHVLFVVRDDDRASQVLYGVPFTTYQAYNDWGGKSIYDWNSSGANTVAGAPRAVSVSFDRPYGQVWNPWVHDWWARTDYQAVFWLERMGYDVAYISNTDLERTPALASQHAVVLRGRARRVLVGGDADVAGDGARAPARASSSAAPTTSTGRSASRARRPARSIAP